MSYSNWEVEMMIATSLLQMVRQLKGRDPTPQEKRLIRTWTEGAVPELTEHINTIQGIETEENE